ncbi:unnamed protein product [Moneuplotes crassus]|uniref:Uncharacterized protein n=1 Tax=Euplotes crassus TaxID=5936 RepID=A0AAD1XFC0_EUPCR|nr:unnamed protein product [Moneuplotes crassus]
MELVPGCQAKDCSNVATYFNKDFMVYICDDHCQPSQRENCVKLGGKTEIEEVEGALEVLKMCTKNFCVAINLNSDQEEINERVIFAEEINEKIAEVSKEFENIKENPEFQDYEDIKLKVKGLCSELKENQSFNKFCMENYFYLICDFLKAEKSNISKMFGLGLIKQDEESKDEGYPVDQDLKLLKQEFRDFKKRATSCFRLNTREGLCQCYKLITNKEIENNYISCKFHLDIANPQDLEFIEHIRNSTCVNLDELRILNMNQNIEIAKDFILSSFPNKVERLDLNYNGQLCKIDQIIDIICYVSPRINQNFFLHNFSISQSQMRILFQVANQNWSYFGFPNCKLELETIPNLKSFLNGSVFKSLSLPFCGRPERCDWKNYPERFVNLIKGLSQSKHFKNTLKSIQMNECGMPIEKVRDTLDSNGFNKVAIENHSE